MGLGDAARAAGTAVGYGAVDSRAAHQAVKILGRVRPGAPVNRLEAARSAAPNSFEFARWAAYLSCYFALEPISVARLGEDYRARTSWYATKYSPAFRSEAVAYAATNIPPHVILSVAADLGISDFTLSKWIQRAHVDNSSPEGSALCAVPSSS